MSPQIRPVRPRLALAFLRTMLGLTLGAAAMASCSSDAAVPATSDPAQAIAATIAEESGRAVAIMTTSNAERFLRGDLELRFDGADQQASVSVATNNERLGAVTVDSSIVGGVEAQRWPLTDVWVEGVPRLPGDAVSAQLTQIETLAAELTTCPSNLDGIDAFCATSGSADSDLDLLNAVLDTFNVSRRYVSADPVDITVWVDRSNGTLAAFFVESTGASDGTSLADELIYEMRYSDLGQSPTFSEITVVCAGLASEAEYTACLTELGVASPPPWSPAE